MRTRHRHKYILINNENRKSKTHALWTYLDGNAFYMKSHCYYAKKFIAKKFKCYWFWNKPLFLECPLSEAKHVNGRFSLNINTSQTDKYTSEMHTAYMNWFVWKENEICLANLVIQAPLPNCTSRIVTLRFCTAVKQDSLITDSTTM